MKRSFLILGAVINIFAGSFAVRGENVVWNNAADGSWSATDNWTPAHVPGATDTAIITNTGTYTVTLDADATIGGLVLGTTNTTGTQTFFINGNTLSLGGTATVGAGGSLQLTGGTLHGDTTGAGGFISGTLTCANGVLSGNLTVNTNGTVELIDTTSGGTAFNSVFFTNNGTVNWRHQDPYGNGAQIYNCGLWDAKTNGTLSDVTFNNSGTFRKSGGDMNTSPYRSWFVSTATFINNGTIDVRSGAVEIDNGSGSGTFNAETNTLIALFSFTLTNNPTFSGPGHLQGGLLGTATLHGVENFDFGTVNGFLTMAADNTLNLLANGTIYFNSGSLTNYGTVNWFRFGADLSGSGAQVVNYGLWDAKTNGTLANVVFNNYGTFRKSGGSMNLSPYRTLIDYTATFVNNGTLDVQSGAVEIDNGNGSGTFNTETNTLISLFSFTLTNNPTFSGLGHIQGGLLGTATLHGIENFEFGTVNGFLTLATNNTLNLLANSAIYFNSGSLTNYGTVNWFRFGADLSGSGAQVVNYGLWDAKTNGTFANVVFNNYGTFRKSGGTMNLSPYKTLIDYTASFTNNGTLDVQTGSMEIDNGGGSGTFNAETNTLISLFSFTLTDNPTFSGPGHLQGGLLGTATLHGVENFEYGTVNGFLTLATNNTLNLLAYSAIYFNSGSLTNYGTVNWFRFGADLSGSGAKVVNYGLWDAKTNGTLANVVFNNYGTFRKSGGTMNLSPYKTLIDYTASFTNNGTLDVQTGSMEIDNGGGGGTFNAEASTLISLFSFTLANNPAFSGLGHLQGGLLGTATLHGVENFEYGTVNGFLTLATNNTLNLLAYSTIYFNSGILTNYGTVNWFHFGADLSGSGAQVVNYGLWDAKTNGTLANVVFNNYGTFRKSGGAIYVSPFKTLIDYTATFTNNGTLDVQTGTLELDGPYALNDSGTLSFGLNSLADHGSLDLTGTPALTGALSVNLNNGYSPALSNSFALLTYGSETGAFTSRHLPHLPAPLYWKSNYGTNAFTVSVAALPPLQMAPTSATGNRTNLSFVWNAFDGANYQVQWTTNLAPAAWTDLDSPINGTNGPVTTSDLIDSAQKFYRIVILP